MKIKINNMEIEVEEGDQIEIGSYECGRCDSTHYKVEVYRNGKCVEEKADDLYYK